MTGTSRALKRLGVTGLGAAIISVGLVPLTEIAANAVVYPTTTATSVSLSPDTDTAAVNACNPFTITVGGPANRSVSVNIQQAVAANAAGVAAGTVVIGFCQPLATNPDAGPTATQAGPGTPGATTSANTATTCTNTALAANTAGNVSCDTTYTDTNNDGTIVIGVTSNTAGNMSVTAFGDANGNGAQDAGEPGDTSAKTWVANDKNAAADKITCTPATETNPTNGTTTWKCTVTDANGNGLAGADNVKYVVTSGPDTNAVPTACTTTADGTLGTTAGESSCTLNNGGQPGHDVITVYLEQNSIVGQQAGEPSTTITRDWVQSAAAGSTLTIDCSPHETSTTAAAGNPPTGAAATCQEDPSQKSVTITATVKNGSPAQPQVGVVVTFDQPNQTSGAVDTDTETVSPTSCVTDSSGSCSTTFNDPSPVDGETFDVAAHLTRQAQATANATATIIYHTATANEARNITVAPASASQTQGGAQSFTASVTDRFGNPVTGACIGWTESGPGRFSNPNLGTCNYQFANPNGYGAACQTSASGSCSVEVTSLSTESGTETVTAEIDSNPASAGDNYPANRIECQAPADRTFTGVNNSTTTPPGDASPGAPAGNCSSSGTVTWKAATPPPTTTKKQHPYLNCWSPRAHVLKCKVVSHPRVQGATVKFRRVHRDGTFGKIIAIRTTDASGVAKFKKRHLKSGKIWRVIAHVGRVGNVRGGYSNVDKVRIR